MVKGKKKKKKKKRKGKETDPHARDMNQHTPLQLAKQFQAKNVEYYLKTLDDLDTDTDQDDIWSDLGITNGTYESDSVFESEPSSNRVSLKSNVSIPWCIPQALADQND